VGGPRGVAGEPVSVITETGGFPDPFLERVGLGIPQVRHKQIVHGSIPWFATFPGQSQQRNERNYVMMIAQFDAEVITETGMERIHSALIIEQDANRCQLVAMGIVANLALGDVPELVKWFTLSSPTYVSGPTYASGNVDDSDSVTELHLGRVIQRFQISDDPWNMCDES